MPCMESPARVASALIAIGCSACAWADVRLPPAFADGMVLQRDRPIHVHGSAQPNEEVMVELRDATGAVVRSGRTVTGQGGRFTLDLPAMPGSPDALELEVRGANTVLVRDVVMGDVWVAGGQSNMEWPVAATGAQADAAVAAADDPMIRILKVPHETAGRARSTADVRWQKASTKTVLSMSAVAFWFAKDIRARTGVPVGIISSNWGGTRAEPWVDLATLGADPAFTDRVAELRARVEEWNQVPPDERERLHQDAMRSFQAAGTQWWTDVNAAEPGIEGKWMLPATAIDGPVGPMELRIPAIEGIGGAPLYLVDRYGQGERELSIYDVDFRYLPGVDRHPRGVGLTQIDHITHNVERGRMQYWADFYQRLFNFREIRHFDIEGQHTGLTSKAMTGPCGKLRIPINESADDRSQIAEYLQAYRGEGIQHIALATDDICATVDRLRANGVPFLAPPPDTYYEAVDERLPGHGEDIAALRQRALLIDGAGPGRLLLQIFTETQIGPIFFEIIQRKGDEGFGEGNFKALFESMERDQIRRGALAA